MAEVTTKIKREGVVGNETYSPSSEELALIEKWKKRFTRAENYLRPYRAKWLRMYKLYRAYQEKMNYAYKTRLMPPIAFQIVETVASRMITAKRKTRVLPREKKDVNSKSVQAWDDLVNYDFDVMKLQKKLPRWVKSAITFGNGIAMVSWLTDESIDHDDPFLAICDLWDILPAPETEDLEEDCPWLIRRILKSKSKIEREEKARGDNALYENVNFLQPKQIDDWKQERYDINIKKMGQIQSAESRVQGDSVIKISSEKYEREKLIEVWECYDFEEGKLITLGNREILMRNDENPYQEVNHGRIFLNLYDHEVNWELWAIGHIEPVETTIVEIADLRNQRMDDVILMLDPVIKIRKDSGISKNDIIFAPGAKWELRKMDDVVVERLPDISLMGVNEERMLHEEIEKTLAISEYVQGVPKSSSEPLGKVAMLIGQSNLRLSSFAQNLSETLTRLANILIEMNQEFIEENKLYRVVGDDVSFKEFTSADKKIKVDAVVAVDPIIPPDQQTRLNQVLLLYDKLVAQDKPDPNNIDEFKQWKKRKRVIQEMILEEMDKEAYRAILLGEEPDELAQKEQERKTEELPVITEPKALPEKSLPATPQPQPSFMKKILSRIPFIGSKIK
ncbi:MAG: hypothetical protein WC848_04525 [Parcubacteria group bacterium]|jgi:hypothetical protein